MPGYVPADVLAHSLLTSEEKRRLRVRNQLAARSRSKKGYTDVSSYASESTLASVSDVTVESNQETNGWRPNLPSLAFPMQNYISSATSPLTLDYAHVPLSLSMTSSPGFPHIHPQLTHMDFSVTTSTVVHTDTNTYLPASSLPSPSFSPSLTPSPSLTSPSVADWPPYVKHPLGRIRLLHCPLFDPRQLPKNKAPAKGDNAAMLALLTAPFIGSSSSRSAGLKTYPTAETHSSAISTMSTTFTTSITSAPTPSAPASASTSAANTGVPATMGSAPSLLVANNPLAPHGYVPFTGNVLEKSSQELIRLWEKSDIPGKSAIALQILRVNIPLHLLLTEQGRTIVDTVEAQVNPYTPAAGAAPPRSTATTVPSSSSSSAAAAGAVSSSGAAGAGADAGYGKGTSMAADVYTSMGAGVGADTSGGMAVHTDLNTAPPYTPNASRRQRHAEMSKTTQHQRTPFGKILPETHFSGKYFSGADKQIDSALRENVKMDVLLLHQEQRHEGERCAYKTARAEAHRGIGGDCAPMSSSSFGEGNVRTRSVPAVHGHGDASNAHSSSPDTYTASMTTHTSPIASGADSAADGWDSSFAYPSSVYASMRDGGDEAMIEAMQRAGKMTGVTQQIDPLLSGDAGHGAEHDGSGPDDGDGGAVSIVASQEHQKPLLQQQLQHKHPQQHAVELVDDDGLGYIGMGGGVEIQDEHTPEYSLRNRGDSGNMKHSEKSYYHVTTQLPSPTVGTDGILSGKSEISESLYSGEANLTTSHSRLGKNSRKSKGNANSQSFIPKIPDSPLSSPHACSSHCPSLIPQPSYHLLHSPYYSCPGYSFLSCFSRSHAILFFARVCATLHIVATQPSSFLPIHNAPLLSAPVTAFITMTVMDVAYPIVLIPPVLHKNPGRHENSPNSPKISQNDVSSRDFFPSESLFFPGVALPPLSLLPHSPSLAYLLLSIVRAMLLGPHGHVLSEELHRCGLFPVLVLMLEQTTRDKDASLLLLAIFHILCGDRGTDANVTGKYEWERRLREDFPKDMLGSSSSLSSSSASPSVLPSLAISPADNTNASTNTSTHAHTRAQNTPPASSISASLYTSSISASTSSTTSTSARITPAAGPYRGIVDVAVLQLTARTYIKPFNSEATPPSQYIKPPSQHIKPPTHSSPPSPSPSAGVMLSPPSALVWTALEYLARHQYRSVYEAAVDFAPTHTPFLVTHSVTQNTSTSDNTQANSAVSSQPPAHMDTSQHSSAIPSPFEPFLSFAEYYALPDTQTLADTNPRTSSKCSPSSSSPSSSCSTSAWHTSPSSLPVSDRPLLLPLLPLLPSSRPLLSPPLPPIHFAEEMVIRDGNLNTHTTHSSNAQHNSTPTPASLHSSATSSSYTKASPPLHWPSSFPRLHRQRLISAAAIGTLTRVLAAYTDTRLDGVGNALLFQLLSRDGCDFERILGNSSFPGQRFQNAGISVGGYDGSDANDGAGAGVGIGADPHSHTRAYSTSPSASPSPSHARSMSASASTSASASSQRRGSSHSEQRTTPAHVTHASRTAHGAHASHGQQRVPSCELCVPCDHTHTHSHTATSCSSSVPTSASSQPSPSPNADSHSYHHASGDSEPDLGYSSHASSGGLGACSRITNPYCSYPSYSLFPLLAPPSTSSSTASPAPATSSLPFPVVLAVHRLWLCAGWTRHLLWLLQGAEAAVGDGSVLLQHNMHAMVHAHTPTSSSASPLNGPSLPSAPAYLASIASSLSNRGRSLSTAASHAHSGFLSCLASPRSLPVAKLVALQLLYPALARCAYSLEAKTPFLMPTSHFLPHTHSSSASSDSEGETGSSDSTDNDTSDDEYPHVSPVAPSRIPSSLKDLLTWTSVHTANPPPIHSVLNLAAANYQHTNAYLSHLSRHFPPPPLTQPHLHHVVVHPLTKLPVPVSALAAAASSSVTSPSLNSDIYPNSPNRTGKNPQNPESNFPDSPISSFLIVPIITHASTHPASLSSLPLLPSLAPALLTALIDLLYSPLTPLRDIAAGALLLWACDSSRKAVLCDKLLLSIQSTSVSTRKPLTAASLSVPSSSLDAISSLLPISDTQWTLEPHLHPYLGLPAYYSASSLLLPPVSSLLPHLSLLSLPYPFDIDAPAGSSSSFTTRSGACSNHSCPCRCAPRCSCLTSSLPALTLSTIDQTGLAHVASLWFLTILATVELRMHRSYALALTCVERERNQKQYAQKKSVQQRHYYTSSSSSSHLPSSTSTAPSPVYALPSLSPPPSLLAVDYLILLAGAPHLVSSLRTHTHPYIHLAASLLTRVAVLSRPAVARLFMHLLGPVVMRVMITAPVRVPPLLRLLRTVAPSSTHLPGLTTTNTTANTTSSENPGFSSLAASPGSSPFHSLSPSPSSSRAASRVPSRSTSPAPSASAALAHGHQGYDLTSASDPNTHHDNNTSISTSLLSLASTSIPAHACSCSILSRVPLHDIVPQSAMFLTYSPETTARVPLLHVQHDRDQFQAHMLSGSAGTQPGLAGSGGSGVLGGQGSVGAGVGPDGIREPHEQGTGVSSNSALPSFSSASALPLPTGGGSLTDDAPTPGKSQNQNKSSKTSKNPENSTSLELSNVAKSLFLPLSVFVPSGRTLATADYQNNIGYVQPGSIPASLPRQFADILLNGAVDGGCSGDGGVETRNKSVGVATGAKGKNSSVNTTNPALIASIPTVPAGSFTTEHTLSRVDPISAEFAKVHAANLCNQYKDHASSKGDWGSSWNIWQDRVGDGILGPRREKTIPENGKSAKKRGLGRKPGNGGKIVSEFQVDEISGNFPTDILTWSEEARASWLKQHRERQEQEKQESLRKKSENDTNDGMSSRLSDLREVLAISARGHSLVADMAADARFKPIITAFTSGKRNKRERRVSQDGEDGGSGGGNSEINIGNMQNSGNLRDPIVSRCQMDFATRGDIPATAHAYASEPNIAISAHHNASAFPGTGPDVSVVNGVNGSISSSPAPASASASASAFATSSHLAPPSPSLGHAHPRHHPQGHPSAPSASLLPSATQKHADAALAAAILPRKGSAVPASQRKRSVALLDPATMLDVGVRAATTAAPLGEWRIDL